MKLRVAGAAVATASAAAAPASSPVAPPPPPPPPTAPPTPPSAIEPSPTPAETDAGCSSSRPASGSAVPTRKPTTRPRQHRILAGPRATKAWLKFRLSLAWLRRPHHTHPKPAPNSPNTHTHPKPAPSALTTAAARPSPRPATPPASSTRTFTTTCTAACTASTASTLSFADSLAGAGMPSRYSNTSADSGAVPSPAYPSRRSTAPPAAYKREEPLFAKPGQPRTPFLDGDACCDRSVGVPTVEQCMEVISVEPNTTLMHSGGVHSSGALKKVLEEQRDYLKGYTPLSFKHISRDFSQLYANVPQAWSSLSTALARLTSGVVYVLLPEGAGTDFPPGGHFSQNEWPWLGPNVTHVIRINEHNRNREVIYTRPDLRQSYERQPTPEPYSEPLREFGYPLTPCPSCPKHRADSLEPPSLASLKLSMSPDGRSFKAGPDFRFGYTSDERSRGRAPLLSQNNFLRSK